MNNISARVLSVKITREEIDINHKTAGAEINTAIAKIMPSAKNLLDIFPMAKEHLEVEIDGIPSAVANALRRTLKDELRSHCLTFNKESIDRESMTDPFMADEDFILTRIRMIRLRPHISEHLIKTLQFALYAENTTATVMSVYSGDLSIVKGSLEEPLFNPTYVIASLQPGRTLYIKDIHIVEGIGRENAAFTVAVLASSVPVDLEEHPKEATHNAYGAAACQSGYIESSLVADPRHHKISAYLPAVPAKGKSTAMVLNKACESIMERLNYIQGILKGTRTRKRMNLK